MPAYNRIATRPVAHMGKIMHTDRISTPYRAPSPGCGPRPNPATREIRRALAASATVLAMAGSGVAGAACNFTGPTTVTCTAGAYNAGLPGGSFVPVVDLTLVLDPGVTIDPASGVDGVTANWGGDVTVTTSADINTLYADGIYLYGSVSATLNNSGTIYAYVDDDNAVDISANGNVSLVNSGSIQAEGYNGYAAVAVHAYASAGDISLQNSGTIAANSDTQYSEAIYAYAAGGNLTIVNSGTISSTSLAASADAIDAEGAYDVVVINSGSIYASSPSYYGTTAVFVLAGDDGSADNSGTIYAYSSAFAGGIQVITTTGLGTASNSGQIDVVSSGGFATGMGFYGGSANASNSGTITATGYDDTAGIYVLIDYDAVVSNSGVIVTDANGSFLAHFSAGIAVLDYGSVDVQNSGTISATSSTIGYYASRAYGIYARGDDDVTVSNSGDISAIATAVNANPTAIGIEAYSYGGNASVSNSGSIYASAYTAPPLGVYVKGVYVHALLGDAYFYNSGNVSVDTTYDGRAVVVDTQAGNISIVTAANSSISATTDYAVIGLQANATTGDISINNAGAISAITAGSNAYGIVTYTTGNDGDIAIVNAGDITATTAGVSAYGMRVRTFGNYSDIDVSIATAASIHVDAGIYRAAGVYVRATGVGSEIAVSNSGSLDVSGYYAWGMFARALGYASGYNDGDIVVDSEFRGVGMRVRGDEGAYALNAGDITVSVDNAVVTYVPQAWGMAVSSRNGDVYAGNTGTISVSLTAEGYPEANAVGIDSNSTYGDVIVANSGLIQVEITSGLGDSKYHMSDAIGVQLGTGYGSGALYNSGTIETASVHGGAFGTFLVGLGSFEVVNTGAIYAHSGDGAGSGLGAFGVFARSPLDFAIANEGTITAVADGGPYADAAGIYLRLTYGAASSIDITNDGHVSASAYGAYTVEARAIYALAGYVEVSTGANSRITAAAGGNVSALAEGIFAEATYAAFVSNSGNILVTNGDGDSYGIYAIVHDGELVVENSGVIDAQAEAYVHGIRAKAYGNGDLLVRNNGSISATGGTLSAVGIQADAYGTGDMDVVLDGGSVIVAVGFGDAAGVAASPYGGGGTSIHNQGDIYAYSAAGDAFGIVTLYGTGAFNISNSGTITAVAGAGSAYAIYANTLAGAPVVIDNIGTLTGAVLTGAGDDVFNNTSTGTWNATGSSYFGAGDDAIYNSGTINLQGATIDLGLDPAGNQFVNDGLLTVSGSNVIDMGTGTDLVTPNPYPFQNNGVIDFQDGSPDDSLAIIGDFAGDGVLDVDVSGLNGTSDLLYIDGDVAPDSTSTININLIDFPESDLIDAPMVVVTGSSVPGNFVLGELSYEPGFLDFQTSLVSGTNSSGQASYALRFVPELSDTGELASLITPGVSMLMRDAVGTAEQRQSTSQLLEGQSRFSMWARVFYNAGWVEPTGGASFDMHTGGGETGFNFAANDRFGAGLILGRSELKQKLRDGVGSDSIKGNVYGGYGNMALPGGFSLDLSHRRLKFDAQIDSSGIELSSGGEADTSNMEAGYRWLSEKKKLDVQLQFQQTITRITSLDSIAGPLPFEGENARYSLTRVAGEVRKTWDPTPKGTIWLGRVLFHAIREFDGTSHYDVGNTLSGKTSIQGTSFRIEAGASAQRGHMLVFGSLSYENGGALHDFFGAHLGGRWVW
jgi:hypothetical protein